MFRHALIREAARNSLLRARHQELHGQIADLLVQRPRVADEQPEVLAGHLEAAERFGEAIGFRLAAALRSLQGSSYQEADLHLGRAISLAQRMPEGPERDGLELSARVLAGVTLTATRGWTDPEVEAHFQRAREIGARVGDVPQLFPALSGPALVPDRQRPVRGRRGDGPRATSSSRPRPATRASSSRPRSSWATS